MRGKERGSRKKDAVGSGHEGLPGKPPFLGAWESGIPLADAGPGRGGGRDAESPPVKNSADFTCAGVTIHIENYCPAARLEELIVDEGICMFSRSNPERQKKALVNVANSDDGDVVAATSSDLLVAYIGIHHPSEGERWGKPGYPWLFEFGAIEVSRNYREMHLAGRMLDLAFRDPYYDDKIMITTGFTWHWDLERTGMNKLEYHELGVRLFGRYGFMEMATDEPNVAMDPANLFMVRIGRNASFSRYQKFASLLFSNEWEAMLRGL